MYQFPEQPNFAPKPSFFKRAWRKATLSTMLVVISFGFLYLATSHKDITVQSAILHPFGAFLSADVEPTPVDHNYEMPTKESNRLDILILGMRGQDDPDAKDGGPLLTDSIQLFSYDKTTKKASLVSIPRDLYVKIHDNKSDKVNSAYEWGINHTPDGLEFIKTEFSKITGVYVDKVVVFDFSSFKEIVNAVGGIDVTLDKPFSESQQWGYSFSLPAGVNHLDGQNALYYSRSRYSSSDFDRARRQQQVIFAIKDKLMKLDFVSDPVKTFSILNLVRNNIKTDISIWDIKQMLDLAQSVKDSDIKRFNISTDNYVEQAKGADGAYILVPKGGNLDQIKHFFQTNI